MPDDLEEIGAPPCPVGPAGRAWIEARFAWLVEAFGLERVRGATVSLPDELTGPRWEGSHDAALGLYSRVRERMGLAEAEMEIGFYSEETGVPLVGVDEGSRSGTAGHFIAAAPGQPQIVRVNRDGLADGPAVAATLAHEMGHVLLIGEGRIGGAEPDQEPLTDLLTVMLGMGVVTANSAIRELNTAAYWSVGRLGYLRQEQLAYALALFARVRGERRPAWSRALCTDVREWFDESAAFLDAKEWVPLDLERERARSRDLAIRHYATLWRAAVDEEAPTRAHVPWGLVLLALLPLVACLLGVVLPPWRLARERPLHVVNGTPWPATVTLDDGGARVVVAPGEHGALVAGEGTRRVLVSTPHGEERLEVTLATSWSERAGGRAQTVFVLNVHGAAALSLEQVFYGGPIPGAAPPPPTFLAGEPFVVVPGVNDAFTPPPASIRSGQDRPVRRSLQLYGGAWPADVVVTRVAEVDPVVARALLAAHRRLHPGDEDLDALERDLSEDR